MAQRPTSKKREEAQKQAMAKWLALSPEERKKKRPVTRPIAEWDSTGGVESYIADLEDVPDGA